MGLSTHLTCQILQDKVKIRTETGRPRAQSAAQGEKASAILRAVAGIDHTSKPTVASGVAWVTVDREIVAFEPKGPTLHLLSTTAAMIWQCFDGTTAISELAVDVADAFRMSLPDAEADVASFTHEMVSLGLFTLHDRGPGGTSRE